MRGEAIIAAVLGRHRDCDHLALQLGQPRGREHQVIVEGCERFELGVVERIGEQHVRYEAELLFAFIEVGLHRGRERARRQIERHHTRVILAWHACAGARGGFIGGRSSFLIGIRYNIGFACFSRHVICSLGNKASPHRSAFACLTKSWRRIRDQPFSLDAAVQFGESRLPKIRRIWPGETPMNIQGQFVSDEDRAVRRLIEQAQIIIKSSRGDVPDSFLPLMFAGVSAEDLVRYEAREIAELAEAAWQFLQQRKAGVPKIRFESRPGPMGAERIRSVSIIEMINNNMPFLLDSVMAELTQQGVDVRLVLHPIFTVERDQTGALVSFRGDGPAVGAAQRESFIHIHVERIEDEARQAQIMEAISAVLADVRVCVQDWRPMMSRVGEVIADIKNNPPPLTVDEIAEATQFLEWLVANNFTFLGVREYRLTAEQDYEPVYESGLGILRNPEVRVLRRGSELVSITPEIMEFLKEPKGLIITKANVRSRVHRRVHMDYIGVKRFDNDGHLVGEFRIVGLFTSTACTRSTRSIPYLRRKVDNLIRRSGFDPDSHSGKAFAAVLESYSRDELFQIDEDTLYGFVPAIMHLDERPRVRVLPRPDRFGRFVSLMVFVPRDRYDSSIRAAIGNYLARVYRGRVSAFYPFFPEGPLVRVHFIIARLGGEAPNPDRAGIEQAVEARVRPWPDGFAGALTLVHEPVKAQQLIRRYREAF